MAGLFFFGRLGVLHVWWINPQNLVYLKTDELESTETYLKATGVVVSWETL